MVFGHTVLEAHSVPALRTSVGVEFVEFGPALEALQTTAWGTWAA